MSQRTRRWMGLSVLLVALAFGVRFWQLGRETPWLDEVFTIMHLHAPSMDAYLSFLRSVCPPALPVYYGLVYLWAQAAGTEILVLRVPHVLAGAASIGSFMVLMQRLGGRRAAFMAGTLLAFSLPHIYYSQELRAYTWIMLWTPVSMWALVRAVEKGGAGIWAVHLAANALLLLSHALNVALLPVQAIYILLFDRSPHRRNGLVWLGVHGLVLALISHWLFSNWENIHAAESALGPRGWRDVIHGYIIFAGARPLNFAPGPYLGPWPNAEPLLLVLWAAVMALACKETVSQAVKAWRRFGMRPVQWPRRLQRRVLLWLWLTVPPLSIYAISWFTSVQFIFRYVMPTLFAMTALAALTLSKRRRRAWRTGAAVLIAGLLAYQAIVYARPFRPDFQAAVRHIQASESAHAAVVVLKDLNGRVFTYMKWLPREQLVVQEGMTAAVTAAADAARMHGAAWLVTWRWDAVDRLETEARREGMAVERIRFGGTPPVIAYRFKAIETPSR